jgi:hypothetical protein
MTVRELIEKLQELDQDKNILMDGYEIGDIVMCEDIDCVCFYDIESNYVPFD